MEVKFETSTPLQFVSRAIHMAWIACGGTTGLGFLADRGGQTEEELFKSIYSPERREIYCDYVQGRMMKFSVKWDDGCVIFSGMSPRSDYQGWAAVYPTYQALGAATEASLVATVQEGA